MRGMLTSVSTASNGPMFHCASASAPVSYTHLDVYKRQVFVRSPDGVLHRVVRHATTTETIAKLESIPSNYHLDCECMLDNGEALAWIGDNLYRQVNGGIIFTAEPGAAPPMAEARKNAKARNTVRDACRPAAAQESHAAQKNVVPSAVALSLIHI